MCSSQTLPINPTLKKHVLFRVDFRSHSVVEKCGSKKVQLAEKWLKVQRLSQTLEFF